MEIVSRAACAITPYTGYVVGAVVLGRALWVIYKLFEEIQVQRYMHEAQMRNLGCEILLLKDRLNVIEIKLQNKI
jgi:hypothetical protein